MISQADQAIFILTTKIKDEEQLQVLQKPLLNLLKHSTTLPNLHSAEVKALPKLAAKEELISKILPKTSFSITYDREFVKKEFLSNPTLIEKANDYVSMLILYYYLSFNMCDQHSTDDIQTILKALLLIIDHELVSPNKMYAKIAKSAFATIILNANLKIDYFKIVNCLFLYLTKRNIPSETLSVIVNMLEKIGNLNNKEEQLGILTNLISNIYKSNYMMFTPELIHQIFLNLRFQLINFSPIAIDFFSDWARRISDDDLKILIQAFPSTIFAYYQKVSSKPNNSLTRVDFSHPYNNDSDILIAFPKSLNEYKNIPNLDYNKFDLNYLNFQNFHNIVQIAHSKNGKFMDDFVNQTLIQLKDEKSLSYYELIATYLHLLIEMSPVKNSKNLSFLFSTPYFSDPPSDSYQLDKNISSIRYLLMNLLIEQNEEFIFSIFDQMLSKSQLFPEFCYRLIYVPDDRKKCGLIKKFFRAYDQVTTHNESKVATLLTFKKYFSSDTMKNKLFGDNKQYNNFMEVIEFGCQKKISFVFQFVLNYCKSYEINMNFIHYLNEYFCEFVNTFLLSGKVSVLQTILRCISFTISLLKVNNSLIANFEQFFNKLCEMISELPKDDENSKNIYIQAFTLISFREFTHNELSSVEATAPFIFTEKSELKHFIQSLMASFQNTNELFLVNQPKAVNLLLKMFKDDTSLYQYFSDLCDFSPINAVQFHHAGLDSLLIEQLLQMKNKNDLEDQKEIELFTTIFYLFLRIAKYTSSVSIINRYMSLLCSNPINNRVSDYHSILVKGLIYLSEEANKVPMTAISDNVLTYDYVEVDCAGFTVNAWIFIPFLFDSNYEESLININESSTHFEIRISNKGFNVYVNSKLVESTIQCKIELSKWACITFRVQSAKTYVFINNQEKGYVSYSPFYLRNPDITFYSTKKLFLGGMTVYKTVVTTNLYEKGARKIWEDAKNVVVLAVRPLWHNNTLVLQTKYDNEVAYKMTGKRSFNVMNFIDVLCERCGITLILPLLAQINMENADPNLLNLILTLVHNLLVDRIISQQKFSEMKGVQILAYLLSVSNTTQLDKNHTSNSSQTNNAYLTFDLYKQLLNTFRILTNTKLKKTFLKYIIMNFSLWIRGYPEEVVKIFDFISHQDNRAIWKLMNITFASAVASIRIFFSHTRIPTINHFNGNDQQYLQIRKDILITCKGSLDTVNLDSYFRVILAHLKCSPNLDDDLDILHLLPLLIDFDNQNGKRITQNSKLMICFLLRKCVKRSKMGNLLDLVEENNEINFDISAEVISAYYSVFAKAPILTIDVRSSFENINFSQNDLIYFLMRWIHDSYICEEFLNKLIPMINGNYPLLFQLAAMISVSLGEEHFINFLHEVSFKPILCQFDEVLWPLWIVIGLYSFTDKGINEGIDFLLNNSPFEQWKNIYRIIEAFSLVFEPYFAVSKMFMHKIFERINSQEMSDLFIDLASSLVLFMKSIYSAISRNESKSQLKFANDTNDIPNVDLSHQISQAIISKPIKNARIRKRISTCSRVDLQKQSSWRSVYYHFENGNENNDPNLNKKLSMSTLDKKLSQIADTITFYEKLLDRQKDEDEIQGNDWYDYELSKKIIQAFMKYPNEIYYDMMIFLESYRLKFDKGEKQLNRDLLKLINENRLRHFNYVAYFNKVCKDLHLESPFSETSDEDIYRIPEIALLNRFKQEFTQINNRLVNVKQIYDNFEHKESDLSNKLYNQTVQDYITRVGLRISKARKYWNLFCNTNMAGSESPWHLAIKPSKVFYKRDTSSCFCFCPSKIRINHKYDPHLMATYKRDTGSQKTAEDLYQDFLNKRVKKESEYFNDLFDISRKVEGNEIEDISNYIFQLECEIIEISKTTKALFTLFKTGIVIQTDEKVKKYPLRSIERILLRDNLHRPTAIELFMNTGVSVFINFQEHISNVDINAQIYSQIIHLNNANTSNHTLSNDFCVSTPDIQRCSTVEYFQSKRIAQMWIENKISNFEYLMYLNIYSSRSFLNASQYPFLPWIIKEYKKELLTVKCIRPLFKPIGALNQVRLGELLLKYLDKKETGESPFIYSSGPMTPLALYYWLIRLEPFTTFHIEMQSGSFDNADRIFSSWQRAFEQVMNIDGAFRELPPEAFFSHGFMMNYNEFNLGLKTESDDPPDNNSQNVILPPWAHTPMDFIYINRKMLESEYVSRNLNEWIDLIWGPNQNGKLAEEALNVYRPEMYHDIWVSDFGRKEENAPLIEAYLSQVGQIPIQLFQNPHPKKRIVVRSNSDYPQSGEISHHNSLTNLKELDLVEELDQDGIRKIGKMEAYYNKAVLKRTERIYIKELQSCFAINISLKRRYHHDSFDYNVPHNEIKIYGLSENADVTIARIGYNLKVLDDKVHHKAKKADEDKNQSPKHSHSPSKRGLLSPASDSKSKAKNEKESIDAPSEPVEKEHKLRYVLKDVLKSIYRLEEDFGSKTKSSPEKNLKLVFKFFDDTKICYTDNFSHELIYYDLLDKSQFKKRILLENQNKITCIDFDNNCFICAFDFDGFLSVIQIDNTKMTNTKSTNGSASSLNLDVLFTIPSFHEKVHACFISKEFHQVVCGSNDGSILIASLSTQTFVRKITLEKGLKPKFIMITKAWGFIFVVITKLNEGKTKTLLAVYTINGDFIRMKSISQSISKIITWRTKTGFDFFSFATPENQICYGEVYTLDIYENNYSVSDTVMAMDYDYDLEATIVVSKDGYVTFLPCRANPPEF